MQIHQLPAATAIADADMLPIDTGSATKYITAANLLKQQKLLELSTTQAITTSIDALGNDVRHYCFIVSSYGHKDEVVVPENASYYGEVYVSNSNYKLIVIYNMSSTPTVWVKAKNAGTWGNWRLYSGIFSGTITRGAMMVQSDNVNIDASGATGILRICARIATAGTYGDTDYLVTSSIKPSRLQFESMSLGSGSAPVKIDTSGRLIFQSSQTVTANTWLIGQIVFPIADWGV